MLETFHALMIKITYPSPHRKLRKACHPSNKSSNKSDSLSRFLNKKDVGYAKEERKEIRACSKA
jgi:hypothetical protein